VHLVGFIIRIYKDARSPERQIRIFICYSFSVLNTMLPACKPDFVEGSRTTWKRWSGLLYTFSLPSVTGTRHPCGILMSRRQDLLLLQDPEIWCGSRYTNCRQLPFT